MKICVFTHTFPRFEGDSVSPFMGEFASALARSGNEVAVLVPFESRLSKNDRSPIRIVSYKYIFPDSLHRLGYSKTLDNDKSLSLVMFLLSPFLYFFGFIALLRLVRGEKFDVISTHWAVPNGFICSLVSFLTGVPYTVTLPGSDVYMGSKNFLFKFLVGFGVMKADWVISDSKFYIRQLNDLGFKPKKTSIIRYGVDSIKFKITKKDTNLMSSLGIVKGQKVVLALGRLVEKKGFAYLFDSMPEIIKKYRNVKFVIVGDGDQREILENKIDNNRLRDYVALPGMIPFSKLVSYYNLADIFVMPSIRDNKGNIDASPVSMMEAMMCGVPVVATKYAGGEEIIKNNETGFIVTEKNSKAIAESVLKLLNKKNLHSMRETTREMAIKNLSISSCVKSYLDIFYDINAKN